MSKEDFQSMLDYEDRQRRKPPEERDKPPLFKVDYINLDEPKKVVNENGDEEVVDVPVDYMAKKPGELKALCKKRGITYKREATHEELAALLTEADKKHLAWTDTFMDLNKFAKLSDEERLAYLTSIFGLPEGMDEESAEAADYSDKLVTAVQSYSTMKNSPEVVSQLKEILDYYNS